MGLCIFLNPHNQPTFNVKLFSHKHYFRKKKKENLHLLTALKYQLNKKLRKTEQPLSTTLDASFTVPTFKEHSGMLKGISAWHSPSQSEQHRLNSAIWHTQAHAALLWDKGQKFLNKYPFLSHGKSWRWRVFRVRSNNAGKGFLF